jgi:hypothetical protein
MEDMMSMTLMQARAALEKAGYDVSSDSDDEGVILAIGDDGDDDETPDNAIASIRAIVGPLGCEAAWTGNGNTGADGLSTSDVAVTVARGV